MRSRLLGQRARRGIKLAAIAAAPICISSFARHVQAEIIGVQFFDNGSGASSSTAPSLSLTSSETAGVPSDATNGNASYLQDNWNTQGAAPPGTNVTGSIASGSLVDGTGNPNALSIAFNWESGDSGGTHKGGVYNTQQTSTNLTSNNPNGSGYNQVTLLDGSAANNSNGTSSFAEFTNVPTSGYTFTLVAYTELYGTTVARLTVGGISGSGNAPTSGLVTGQTGGFGTNSVTGTDNVYVIEQAGGATSATNMNSTLANFAFDGSTYISNPVTFGTQPTAVSNYVSWENVVPDSSGNIELEWNKYSSTGITTDTNVTVDGISAIQLIATPNVPEPASLGLLALGGSSLLIRRRKNRAKA